MKTITDTQRVIAQEEKEIIRKVYWSDNTAFVSLDPTLIKKLNIDHHTYFQQVATPTGINLIIRRLA